MAVLTSSGITFSNATVTDTDLVPTGSIITTAFTSTTFSPSGFLYCNGQAVSRTTYSALFTVISTAFGAGDGSTTFNVPDFRGEFIRGWDDARGVDSGRTFRSFQNWTNLSHSHNCSGITVNHSHGGNTSNENVDHAHGYDVCNDGNRPADGGPGSINQGSFSTNTGNANSDHAHGFDTSGNYGNHVHVLDNTGGTTSVPRNIALYFWIKI
jgi:microcystin-dependent protein